MENRLTVFISYSWDSPEHKEWVLKLANYLMERAGCIVLLDQYELSAGKELTFFMENGLEKADKVIIVLTEEYKKRAMKREGGIGFESSMISQGLYDLQANNNKFIPVLRQGTRETSAPIYIGTKVYHSMKDDSKFLNDAFILSKILYEEPEIVKPPLGAKPDFSNPDYDPIIATANELTQKEKLNKELDKLIESEVGVQMAKKEVALLFEEITDKANDYNEKTDFTFKIETNDRQTSLLIMSLGYTVTFEWHIVAWNSARGAELIVKMWNDYRPMNQQNSFSFPDERPKLIATASYFVDFNDSKQVVWRNKDKGDIVTESQKLNRAAFVFIMQSIQEEKEKQFRK